MSLHLILTKKGIAKQYSEGKVSLVVEANVPKNKVVVDTRNLQRVLKAHGQEGLFSEGAYSYFKSEAEVIVQDPTPVTVFSVK